MSHIDNIKIYRFWKGKQTGVRSGGVYQMWSKGNANGISYGRCLNCVAFHFTLSFIPYFLFCYFNRKWWRYNLSLLNLLLPSWPSNEANPINNQSKLHDQTLLVLHYPIILYAFVSWPPLPPSNGTNWSIGGGRGGRFLWWWWWCGFTTYMSVLFFLSFPHAAGHSGKSKGCWRLRTAFSWRFLL